MGWWPVNLDLGTDDRVGDDPEDELLTAFERVAGARAQRGEEKPRLQEVLDALVFLLNRSPSHQAQALEELSASVCLEGEEGPMLVHSSARADPSGDLVEALMSALDEIAHMYEETWERPVRFREMCALFADVLSEETCSSDKAFYVERIFNPSDHDHQHATGQEQSILPPTPETA